MDLTILVYDMTASFPKQEMYGLTSQMRRAAVSIASNLAEGSARHTKRDFRNFVSIARGSNAELQTQLILSARLGYGAPEHLKKAEELALEVGRMLHGLSKFLKANSEHKSNNKPG